MEHEVITPVVGWFSLSLIISGLAQALNRDGFAWWFLGLLFGPVALFFLVLTGREPCSDCQKHKATNHGGDK